MEAVIELALAAVRLDIKSVIVLPPDLEVARLASAVARQDTKSVIVLLGEVVKAASTAASPGEFNVSLAYAKIADI